MRPRFNNQPQFCFQAAPTLKITEQYYAKYDRIDAILAAHPELVELIHRDIAEPLDCEKALDATGEDCYKCSSETVLCIVGCQIIGGAAPCGRSSCVSTTATSSAASCASTTTP